MTVEKVVDYGNRVRIGPMRVVTRWTEPGWEVPPARLRARVPDAPYRAPEYDHVGQVTNRNARILLERSTRAWSATGFDPGWYGCACRIIRITDDLSRYQDVGTTCTTCGKVIGATWRPVVSQLFVGPTFAACYELDGDGVAKFKFGYVLEGDRGEWKIADGRTVLRTAKQCPVA